MIMDSHNSKGHAQQGGHVFQDMEDYPVLIGRGEIFNRGGGGGAAPAPLAHWDLNPRKQYTLDRGSITMQH